MMNPVDNAAKQERQKQQQAQRQVLLDAYQVSPDECIETLGKQPPQTPLLVDFDETLWLRNSTEAFYHSIQPSVWVAIILQLLGLLKPWRWFGDEDPEHRREWFRLKVILLLCPWAVSRWEAHAKQLGPRYVNQPLLSAIQQYDADKIHIVSFGYDFILQPLLAAIDPRLQLTMCSTVDDAVAQRQRGKAAILTEKLGELLVRRSLCITDSLLDRDLLKVVEQGILVKWPEAKADPAGLSPMLPFVFTKKVNRPKELYFTRVILGHDYIGLVLAFVLVSSQPLVTAASLLLFVLAYFSIYETGYYENDRLGLIFEEKPRVSEQFLKMGHHFNPTFAWICGAIIALPAAWLSSLGSSWLPTAYGVSGLSAVFAIWATFMAFMVVVRGVFYWFNRTPVQGRILPMLLLQFARNCGYILLFPTIVAGGIFCLSWTLGKWVPYILYRFKGSAMGYPNHLVTALLMLSMMVMVGASSESGFSAFYNWPSAIMVLYILARGGKDLWSFRAQLTPLKPIAGRESTNVRQLGEHQ